MSKEIKVGKKSETYEVNRYMPTYYLHHVYEIYIFKS